VTDYATAKSSDTGRFARWFRSMLDGGIYWPPSHFEAAFLSAVMTDDDASLLVDRAAAAFRAAAG
jgi:glutamate-1-semialdehyde 2,1-aminomutase